MVIGSCNSRHGGRDPNCPNSLIFPQNVLISTLHKDSCTVILLFTRYMVFESVTDDDQGNMRPRLRPNEGHVNRLIHINNTHTHTQKQ